MITKTGKTISAVGYRVLLKLADDTAEEKTEWGFIMDVGDDFKRQKASSVIGEVIEIGPMAWCDVGDGEPWCKVGDIVYYAKFAGKFIKIDDEDYLIVNDKDIQLVISEGE
jgi:co-chaperonin GroES (HSP10)